MFLFARTDLGTRVLQQGSMPNKPALFLTLAGLCFTLPAQQQHSADRGIAEGPKSADPEEKRLFGIIPNYRTSPSLVHYQTAVQTLGESLGGR